MTHPGVASSTLEGAWPTEIVSTTFGAIEAVRGDLISRQLQRFGAHQRHELAMLSAFLRPGDRVLDVGAHIGTFALPLAQRVGTAGQVVAFEALPQHVAILRRNVERLSTDESRQAAPIEIHHALISSTGQGRFTAWSRPGNSSETVFRPLPESSDEGSNVEADEPATLALDDWWKANPEPIDLIKVDVEGMELDVLRSAEALLHTCRPMLYLEIHRAHLQRREVDLETLDDVLSRHGYHFFRNLGRRNGRSDRFTLGRHRRLRDGGAFFDVLAIAADSPRYPRRAIGPKLSAAWVRGRRGLGGLRRACSAWISR